MEATRCRAAYRLLSRRLPVSRTTCSSAQRRHFQTRPDSKPSAPDFAFAFDIDGVLVRGSHPLPHASTTLRYLHSNRIPFILLTNGGGYSEAIRAEKLAKSLSVPLEESHVIQSHTPFADFDHHKKGTALVVGGEHAHCAEVARKYGYESVVTPSDIYMAHPSIWPFSSVLKSYHEGHARPLPKPVSTDGSGLKIDSIFVYNDPRDWGLDLAIIIDCLLSRQGYIGTISPKNGDPGLPNQGYQQDGQPALYFSNPDLWFAADFPVSRLGQGGFRAAVEGVWRDVTHGATLTRTVMGKPTQETYEFAERKLNELLRRQFGLDASRGSMLKRVYMIGDNPESDIRGGMGYKSPFGTQWGAALVRTGVYQGGEPSIQPSVIVDNVRAAVDWGLGESAWKGRVE